MNTWPGSVTEWLWCEKVMANSTFWRMTEDSFDNEWTLDDKGVNGAERNICVVVPPF